MLKLVNLGEPFREPVSTNFTVVRRFAAAVDVLDKGFAVKRLDADGAKAVLADWVGDALIEFIGRYREARIDESVFGYVLGLEENDYADPAKRLHAVGAILTLQVKSSPTIEDSILTR